MFVTITSAEAVLNTVIGGSAVFLGPALGATFNTLFGYYIGGLSPFWLLYQGLLFVLVIMYAPGGLGGLVLGGVRLARQGQLSVRLPGYLTGALASILIALATVTLVELIGGVMTSGYEIKRLTSGEQWPPLSLWGIQWHPFGVRTLAFITVLIVTGTTLLRLAIRWNRDAEERIGSES
jgi:branched-chain amino acid transport system permease protein